MKRALILSLIGLILLCTLACAEADDRPTVEYYFQNICESCHPELEFEDEFQQLTGKNLKDYRYVFHNVAKPMGQLALDECAARLGLEDISFPLVVFEGRTYMGTNQLYSELPKYSTESSDSTDSMLCYISLPACESCARASEALDALPDTIEVTRGNYSFESALEIIRVDLSADPAMAYALFDAFSVPEDRRIAPMVLAGDSYYAGAESIERFARYALFRGQAMGTPIITPESDTALPALKLGSTFAAGLIGGLNPCALSMLLLFLTMLVNAKGNVKRLAAIFLSAKLVTYLLIGTLFLGLFQLWNPSWLALASKLLLTVFSLLFIFLNTRDAIMARRERYGEIRNQLPPAFRRGIQARIKRAFERSTAHFAWIVVGLGVIVAAGEFLCSGQVYLSTLLAAIRTGDQLPSLLFMLCAYCIAFLLPSAALCALVARGRSAFELSEFMRRHLFAVKMITALFYIAVLTVVWLM